MKKAIFYKKLKDDIVQCTLCPHFCVIKKDKTGKCKARKNINGILYSIVYGEPCAANVDPVEKKPLYHFLPSSDSYSIGTVGCNLACMYCQNYEISQARPENVPSLKLLPKAVITNALSASCKSVAYTYTEPVGTACEYVLDISELAKRNFLKNVMVSNGFINQEPLKKLIPFLDAANIDLKGNAEFYKKITGAWIEPVQETLKKLKEKKVWLEVTNLIVPTMNDSEKDIKELAGWIYDNLGPDTPVHFSAFWPTYKLTNLPNTSLEKLKKARKIAMDIGLKYVYVGNVNFPEGNNTYCPKCKKAVIKREGFRVVENLLKNGKCSCGERIAGVWS
jgi:pyruvate formate lyase activating enzyme